jgi:hypothetical protein
MGTRYHDYEMVSKGRTAAVSAARKLGVIIRNMNRKKANLQSAYKVSVF